MDLRTGKPMILAKCLLLMIIVPPQNQVLSVFMAFCAETLKACSEEAQPLLGKGNWGSLVFSTWQPQVVFVSFFFHLVKKKKNSVDVGVERVKRGEGSCDPQAAVCWSWPVISDGITGPAYVLWWSIYSKLISKLSNADHSFIFRESAIEVLSITAHSP